MLFSANFPNNYVQRKIPSVFFLGITAKICNNEIRKMFEIACYHLLDKPTCLYKVISYCHTGVCLV